MKIKVSSCLIVKNEEQFLDKCLSSIKDFSDEIIVLDTGSTDETIEIAKRYTNKIFHYVWENNFSKAHNYVMSFAKNDWIFIIDGDEYVANEQMQHKIMNFLDNFENTITNVYSFKFINPHPTKKTLEVFYKDSLIKNSPDIFFVKPIHPYIDGKNIVREQVDIEIVNSKNYRNTEVSAEKLKNYFELMMKEINNSKNSYDKVHYIKHLVWDYQEANLRDKALETAYILYKIYKQINYPKTSLDYCSLLLKIAEMEYENKKYFNSLRYIEEGLYFFENNLELVFYKSLCLLKIGKIKEGNELLNLAKKEISKHQDKIHLLEKII